MGNKKGEPWAPLQISNARWLHEERVYKLSCMELSEVVNAFADANVSHRNTELIGDSNHDPTLGGTVEFGEHDPRDLADLLEHFRLLYSHQPGIGIQHQLRLVRCALQRLVGNAPDLLELFHKVLLVGEATRGITNHHIKFFIHAAADAVEDNTCGVGPI